MDTMTRPMVGNCVESWPRAPLEACKVRRWLQSASRTSQAYPMTVPADRSDELSASCSRYRCDMPPSPASPPPALLR